MLYYGRVFFITVIIASMIAFLLDPMVEFFMKLRLPRGLASFVVCSISLMFLYLAGVDLYTQSLAMVDDLPAYSDRINELVDTVATRTEKIQQGIYNALVPKRLRETNQPPQDPQTGAPARGKRRAPVPTPPPAIQEVRVRPEPTSLVDYYPPI
jgi:predicted PurR-regulated permease PerM